MPGFSDYHEKNVLDWSFTAATTPVRPTAWFIGLHTGDPAESGANEISTTGSGYARRTATFAAAASGTGTTDNSNAITFGPATGSWNIVSGVSVWDATTGGNCIACGTLAAVKTIASGDSLTFDVGALDISLA